MLSYPQIGVGLDDFGTRNSLAGDGTDIELPISDAAGNTFAVTFSSERAVRPLRMFMGYCLTSYLGALSRR